LVLFFFGLFFLSLSVIDETALKRKIPSTTAARKNNKCIPPPVAYCFNVFNPQPPYSDPVGCSRGGSFNVLGGGSFLYTAVSPNDE
jgi:hypothetical protein